MNLQIEDREKEKIVILDLKGRLLGENDLSLLQRLLFLLESRHRKVILNFKDLSSVDESGLGTVAFCAMRFQEVGGRLVILNPGQSRVAGVESYEQEFDAVNSFFPNRVAPRYDILEFVKGQQQLREQESPAQ